MCDGDEGASLQTAKVMFEGTGDAERRYWSKVSCASSGSTTEMRAHRASAAMSAPALRALRAFHVQCTSPTPASVALCEHCRDTHFCYSYRAHLH